MMPNFWLMKSEPDVFSISDLERDRVTGWESVRNYLARNYMRDQMRDGDLALFYHSNAEPSGVAGVARVTGSPVPDPTQFDGKSPYFDPKSTRAAPRWQMVNVEFVERFPAVVPLARLRRERSLAKLGVLQKGQRLSVMPVTAKHFDIVVRLGRSLTGRSS
ncbi:MAG: EVE domain-containing protein [Myxococcaceae bacterium]|nr:EVE domain-containing protein [Myxococcaceae bacterium]